MRSRLFSDCDRVMFTSNIINLTDEAISLMPCAFPRNQ